MLTYADVCWRSCSALSHAGLQGKVQALVACEGSSSIAAAGGGGAGGKGAQVEVLRVERMTSGGGGESQSSAHSSLTYVSTVRSIDYSAEKRVLALAHSNKGSNGSLLIAGGSVRVCVCACVRVSVCVFVCACV